MQKGHASLPSVHCLGVDLLSGSERRYFFHSCGFVGSIPHEGVLAHIIFRMHHHHYIFDVRCQQILALLLLTANAARNLLSTPSALNGA